MKRKIVSVLLCVLLLASLLPMSAIADTTASGKCGENLTWTLDSEGTLTISGTGAMEDYYYGDGIPWYEDTESIVKVVVEDGVTSIGDYAFYDCYSLTSVTIPNSVTSIGSSAFDGCSSLASVTIPNSVTSIGDEAFCWCSSLTSVTIPDSVTSIGSNAFNGCSSLASVTIPNSVTSIGEGAFYGCSSLTSVTIGNRVTSIESSTFEGCSSLESVTIPNSVTGIGISAFSGCSSLASVTIPDSVTSVGDEAFYGCSSLESITVGSDNINYSSQDGVLFNKDKTYLIQYPIGNARTSYSIPDSVTSIGYGAFYGCSSLKNVTIPDSVTSIGYSAFSSCENLTDVYFGGSEEQWNQIDIQLENYNLTNATIHYSGTDEHEHIYTLAVTAPTCTEQGYTTHTCACGASYVDSYVDTLGHDFGEWQVTTAATCNDKGVETRYCSRCDETETREIKALGHDLVHHDGKEATCTEAGWEAYDTCSRCDYTTYKEIPATGHSYTSVVTEPTCTEKGYTTHTCACGDSYVDTYTDALGHSYGAWTQTKAPTCTAKGTETKTCTRCNATETRDVEALGHNTTHHAAKAATCTEIGWEAYDTCSRCDYTTYKEIAKTGHQYVETMFAPTCTVKGYTTHICSVCGDNYIDSYVDALGHDRIHHDGMAPTCTESGFEAYDTCSRCDYTTYKEIPATGHHHDAVVTAPTCTEKGYTTHTCACGDSYVDSYTDALGHSYKNGTCTRCGEKDPNYVAAPVLKITTSAGKPKISWSKVDGAAKYKVYYSTDGKKYGLLATTTGTKLVNTSAKIGTTYYYKVSAVDDNGVMTAYSNVESIKCVPAAPTVSISRVSGKAKLSWSKVSGATKYWVYRSTDGKKYTRVISTTKLSYTDSKSASGTKYYYKVMAVAVVNKTNVGSAFSAVKSIMTTLAKPTVKITTSNGKPKLTWGKVTGADKYYVYRSTNGKDYTLLVKTTKTSVTNTGAKKGTKYYYKVKAICSANTNANSAFSAVVSIKATK